MSAWAMAFVLTQLVEIPIYVRALGVTIPAAFAASAITHPIVWFVFFLPAFDAPYLARVAAAELFAWLVEAAWLGLVLRRPHALFWSLIANAASCGAGLASRALFGIP